MGGLVRALALGELVVFDRLQRALDVDVVQPGDVAADDLPLDLIGQINPVLGFEVLGQLEGHELVQLPVRVPDREVGAVDDAVRSEPEEQVGHDFGKEARAVVDEGQRHRERAIDVGAARRHPAEIVEPRQAQVVDDEVQLGVEPGRLVDIAHVEPGEREGLDGGPFVEVHVLDAQLDALLIEGKDDGVVGAPAP